MSEVAISEDQFSIYKKYFPFFSAYAFGVSGLYLWGFWSSFNVNVLQYIDIPGIVKTAIIPLLLAASSLAFGVFMGHFMRPEPETGEALNVFNNSKKVRFIRKYWREILVVWIFAGFVLWAFGNEHKWDYLSYFIATPVAIFLLGRNFMADVFPDRNFRITILFLVTLLVPMSYNFGLREASKIKNGDRYLYVISSTEFNNFAKPLVPQKNVRYIGQVNDFGFFYYPSIDAISVSKLKPGEYISFGYFERPKISAYDSIKSVWNQLWS